MRHGPTEVTTRRQLATIRKAFALLEVSADEVWDPKTETSFFIIDTGLSELETLCFQHSPGVLVAVAELGVHPAEARRAEVERFAARFNASSPTACAMVLSGSPVRLAFRVSVDSSRVQNLEAGYVTALMAQVIDLTPVMDLPLIEIARGSTAKRAVEKLLQLEELPVGPPAKERRRARRARGPSRKVARAVRGRHPSELAPAGRR